VSTMTNRVRRTTRPCRLEQILSESPGPVLAAGKPVLVTDPFEYGQLVKHDAWPDPRLEQFLNEKYFGLIVGRKIRSR
jgi:hypothetical protein